jgi:hypothetical protein
VDWLSVFKNNAQEVRLFVSCRDPSKVPDGRMFEFHKNLFTLGFTVEMPLVETKATDDLLGEDSKDQNRRKEGNGPNRQYNFGNSGNQSNANQDAQSGGGATHQTNHTNRTRMVATQVLAHEEVTCYSASAVFQLLGQKGLVDREGCFI